MARGSVAAELDYDGKRDRWNGYGPESYGARVMKRYKALNEARKLYLKEKQLKKLEEKNNSENQNRASVEAFKWEAFENDVHMQEATTRTQLLIKNCTIIEEKIRSKLKETVLAKYGNAAAEQLFPRQLLQGQSEVEVEYDRADVIAPTEEKQLAIWGTKIPDDLVLDQVKLAEALKKESLIPMFMNPNFQTLMKDFFGINATTPQNLQHPPNNPPNDGNDNDDRDDNNDDDPYTDDEYP